MVRSFGHYKKTLARRWGSSYYDRAVIGGDEAEDIERIPGIGCLVAKAPELQESGVEDMIEKHAGFLPQIRRLRDFCADSNPRMHFNVFYPRTI